MAAMQFSCPHCCGLFQVDSSLGGQQVSCPHCGGIVALPAMAGYPSPAATTTAYPGGGTAGYAPEMPVRAPAPLPGSGFGAAGPPTSSPSHERPVAPAPGIPNQARLAPGQERPLGGPQPQRPLRPLPAGTQAAPPQGQERTLAGPGTVQTPQVPGSPRPPAPQRPAPLSTPAGPQRTAQPPSAPAASPLGRSTAPTVPVVPTTPGTASQPTVPTTARPMPVEPQRRTTPGPQQPETPVSSPLPPVTGISPPAGAAWGATRVPVTGPQPGPAALGSADALLPPATTAGAAAVPGTGTRPQAPFTPAAAAAIRPQPASGPAQPLVVPASDGGYNRLREPTRIVGSGDDALELRSRSGVEKERWRLKKNLLVWTFGLLILGITILILMILGPIQK